MEAIDLLGIPKMNGANLKQSEGRQHDELVLDGPSSVEPYHAVAQFASEIGERGITSGGSGWHQSEFDFSNAGAQQLRSGPIALPTDSEPGRGVEIEYFSLVGFDNPEIENGLEGAFLGVKSSEAIRLKCGVPSNSPLATEDSAPASEQ